MRAGDVAQAWPWERLSQTNAASHGALVDLLEPRPGERVLDLGTGAGGVALRAAARGAEVVGVDIAPAALEQARAAAAGAGVEARFELADVQALPFADASFDVVVSAFGVNFAADHRRAAEEVARVTRPGGRLGLTLMPPASRAAEFWTVLRAFGAGGGDHPAAFAERLDELLGGSFELERHVVETPPGEEPAPEQAWDHFRESFGPLRQLLASLDADRAAELQREFVAVRERFAGRPLTHVLVLGHRR